MEKNSLIRRLWLILKFMTSQTGQQIITLQIMPYISRSRSNQEMKFGQLIRCNINSSFKNCAEYKTGRLVSGLFLFFKKPYIR